MVMAITAVATATTAAAVHVLAVRPRAVNPAPQAAGETVVDLWSGPTAFDPAPSAWRDPDPRPVEDPVEFDDHLPVRWRRLEWAPVVEARPGDGSQHGWHQPVGRAAPVVRDLAAELAHEEHLRRANLEAERRREWQRIAERARRARLALEQTDRLTAADTDPNGRVLR
jgi:hypothetical protein